MLFSNLIPKDTASNHHFYNYEFSSRWKGFHHLSRYKYKQNHFAINGKDILLLIMNILLFKFNNASVIYPFIPTEAVD